MMNTSIDAPFGGAPGRKPLLVCVGDSITQGDTGMGFMAPYPWPQQVGKLLGVDVRNCGYCGASTTDYRTYQPWQAARAALPQATVMTIGLGTNDIDLEHARDIPALERVATQLAQIVDEALAINARMRVVVLSVPQFATAEPIMSRLSSPIIREMNRAVSMLNDCYVGLCERRGWMYLDYADVLNGRRELYGNTIHPNQRGYDAIAAAIARELMPILTPTAEKAA
ncbi:lipolytic protein G-D-S-L family [Bifidobacterium goeldii]|uniref:Lipolytic protein G-D-S-L family n=1 Tax=Bifidobacterium goeldii TaxID=2306975 RepID=A0A430FNJ1_9BIFI|nr:SGNH/GDSL hydrolase family protein [Bifidobacterium goeldii]RSX54402.1 lipolytic protein G-D-S-L family [Bifidobacterium goeldii]